EKALAENVSKADCYGRIVSSFPPKEAAEIAVTLADKTPDRAAALAEMMHQAILEKSYETLGTLIDAGATMGKHAPLMIIALAVCEDENLYNDKDKYLSLFKKVLQTATPQDLSTLDFMQSVIAYKIPDNAQYPEIMDMLLAAGADPFARQAEAHRSLTDT